VIRVYTSGALTGGAQVSLNLSFQEQDISVSVTNTLPQFSESDTSLRLSGAAGFGSTATTTRRFASVLQNLGTDIEYTDSPTLGGQFRARTSGIYNISYSEVSSSNSTVMDANIQVNGVTVATDSVKYNTATADQKNASCSWSGYLTAGDIVTGLVAVAANNNGLIAFFTMSKVGKPNVTGVDVTPFVNVPQPDVQSIEFQTATGAFGSTDTGIPILTASKEVGSGIISVVSNTTNGTSFVALKNCVLDISATAAANPAATLYLTRNAVVNTATNPNVATTIAQAGITAALSANISTSVSLSVGDVVRVHRNSTNITSMTAVSLTATALSDQILTVPETFSTDTAALSYAGSAEYTLTTLENAPVGKYITFTYAASTNTRTQTTARPTQLDSDMNANGIQIFTRAYNATSTAGNPAVIAIQIGKGLKGKSLDLYKSAGKVTAGTTDFSQLLSTASEGVRVISYNEVTGVLIIDAAIQTGSTTTSLFLFGDITQQNNGYLVINASKNPALVGISLPRVYSESAGNAGQVMTVNATDIPFINISDTNGAWNGSQYIVPENGVYSFSGGIRGTTSAARRINIYVNSVIGATVVEDAAVSQHIFSFTRRLNKGDVVALRTANALTLQVLDPERHNIFITKVSN
jgi:hypothetical protein